MSTLSSQQTSLGKATSSPSGAKKVLSPSKREMEIQMQREREAAATSATKPPSVFTSSPNSSSSAIKLGSNNDSTIMINKENRNDEGLRYVQSASNAIGGVNRLYDTIVKSDSLYHGCNFEVTKLRLIADNCSSGDTSHTYVWHVWALIQVAQTMSDLIHGLNMVFRLRVGPETRNNSTVPLKKQQTAGLSPNKASQASSMRTFHEKNQNSSTEEHSACRGSVLADDDVATDDDIFSDETITNPSPVTVWYDFSPKSAHRPIVIRTESDLADLLGEPTPTTIKLGSPSRRSVLMMKQHHHQQHTAMDGTTATPVSAPAATMPNNELASSSGFRTPPKAYSKLMDSHSSSMMEPMPSESTSVAAAAAAKMKLRSSVKMVPVVSEEAVQKAVYETLSGVSAEQQRLSPEKIGSVTVDTQQQSYESMMLSSPMARRMRHLKIDAQKRPVRHVYENWEGSGVDLIKDSDILPDATLAAVKRGAVRHHHHSHASSTANTGSGVGGGLTAAATTVHH